MRLDNYETQATLSVALAAFGGFCAVALAAAIVTAFDRELSVIIFRAGGPRHYAFYALAALAMSASGIGLVIGFNSAGQKSNKLSQRSWLGFFANAGALTLAACTFIFFWFFQYGMR